MPDSIPLFGEGRRRVTPSGLIVALSPTTASLLDAQHALKQANAVDSRRTPSLLDDIVIVADEQVLGLPRTEIPEVRRLLAELPLMPTLLVVAQFAAALHPIRDDPASQLQLAAEAFSQDADLLRRVAEFVAVRDGTQRYVLDEQQLYVLARLTLEEARDEQTTQWLPEDRRIFERAMLGVTSVVGDGARRLRQSRRHADDWVGFFLQQASLNARDQPLLAYARTWRIFAELARSDRARGHASYCPLDQWVTEDSDAALEELFAVGFAAAATATAAAQEGRAALTDPMENYLANTTLAARHDTFTTALAASREEFTAGFARGRDDPLRTAWEIAPFQSKPFFITRTGHLVLISPSAIQSWLSHGFYYRALDSATKRGGSTRDNWTTFWGWLVETYVHEVIEQAHGPRASGHGRVHGEYEQRGVKTPDVAIDAGEDLTLIEVVSVRLPLGVRAEDDTKTRATFLRRALLDKVDQLSDRIDDLFAGRISIPDVEPANVKRIWPVLVTVDDIVTSEALWAVLDRELPHALKQPQSQALTLLDLQDAETLAGMIEQGDQVHEVLADKASGPHAQRSFTAWYLQTRSSPAPRPQAAEQRWRQLVPALANLLSLPPAS
jgi:hypothetical protein